MPSDARDYYDNSDNELARRYLRDSFPTLSKEFFDAAVEHRYGLYPFIPEVADFEGARGKRLLEVGVGQGYDHFMFAKAGAITAGVDITPRHCAMTRRILDLNGLSSELFQADAKALPFADNTFDRVYSCGVLLLVNPIEEALAEIRRVLKPGGFATIMLYNRASVHYWIKSRLYYGWACGEDRLLGSKTVNDWYTDGPGYVDVTHYGPSDLPRLFPGWSNVDYQVNCLSDEQLPGFGVPRTGRLAQWLERNYGFFLWIKATK